MVKKTLGYVELEWTCPSCGTRNPGTQQTCQSCGTKMPEDIEFETPLQQELDTSAETAARVAAGPDIHCPYCGARNPGNAASCSKCGGDLVEGEKRAKGGVVGAYQTGPVPDVTCPHCGTNNPATATKCSSCGGNLERERPKPVAAQVAKAKKTPLIGGGLLALLLCCVLVALFLLFRGSSETVALVQSVEWTYEIKIEELGPVTRQDWREDVPADAELGSCESKEHHVQDDPAPKATEVCTTPEVKDTGTGHGEVVVECRYHVYQDWCEYTVTDWKPAGEKVTTGHDLNPAWPALNLTSKQREGAKTEEYKVIFDADGKDIVYSPGSLSKFKQFDIGSKWLVETNALGGVTSVKSAE